MSSKRRLRKKKCTGKIKYDTEDLAHKTKRKLTGRISVYKCNFCGSFHIGHTPGKIIKFVKNRKKER